MMRKKRELVTCLGLIVVLTLAGCTSGVKSGKSQAKQGEAVENNTRSAKGENSTVIDVAEYEQYEKYGLAYKAGENRFYYDDKPVRKFTDKKDKEGNVNGFSFSSGVVDLETKRDDSYKLNGIQVLSQEEFDKNTRRINEVASLKGTSHERGYVDAGDDTLNEYISYGVSYDKERAVWQYKGEDIYIFYDDKGSKMLQGEVVSEKGISLIVKRDQKGEIKEVLRINAEDVPTYAKELVY